VRFIRKITGKGKSVGGEVHKKKGKSLMSKKKEDKQSWVGKLKEKVQKHFRKKKAAKDAPLDKSMRRQLKDAGYSDKEIEKELMQKKKKRG